MDNSWRSSLANDSRDKIVNRIVSHLQRHMPLIGQDAIDELPRIARRFEEKIFQVANNQTDYLRKISLKMLSFETMSGVRNATSTVDNMANTTDVGEIEEEPSVVNIEPVSTLPRCGVRTGGRSGLQKERGRVLSWRGSIGWHRMLPSQSYASKHGRRGRNRLNSVLKWSLSFVTSRGPCNLSPNMLFPIPDAKYARVQRSEGEVGIVGCSYDCDA